MATYNGSAYLREQVDSILSQLQPGDELLVSDDGSTDDTRQILATYGGKLKIVNERRVGGVVRNFERVLSFAQGDVIVLADQDDVWLPGKLDRLRAELVYCDLVMSNAQVVDAQLTPQSVTLFEQLRIAPGMLKNIWRNSFVGCCMGFRRHLLMRALPFPLHTPWHDWLLGLLGSAAGKVVFLSDPLMLYRRHGSNASETGVGSSNSLAIKLRLRIQIAAALAICMLRKNPRKSSGLSGTPF
jgi:glycosyltransferase involved in cell wall biosynthesis